MNYKVNIRLPLTGYRPVNNQLYILTHIPKHLLVPLKPQPQFTVSETCALTSGSSFKTAADFDGTAGSLETDYSNDVLNIKAQAFKTCHHCHWFTQNWRCLSCVSDRGIVSRWSVDR